MTLTLEDATQDLLRDAIELEVSAVTLEAEGVIGITLRDRHGGDLPAWTPGAHVEMVLPSGRVRQYSLCGSTRDRKTYRIAVLREAGGRGGSAELHDLPLVGRMLKVRGPRNHFELKSSQRYLFIAGGIGITPIIAMIRDLPMEAPWLLYYGGRSRRSMAFTEEAATIGGGRTHLVPEDEQGRLDLDAILAMADAQTTIYCCGPAPLLEAVEARRNARAPETALRFERFTPATVTKAPEQGGEGDSSFEIELRRSNLILTVPKDRSVLSVVRDVLPDMPFSCQEGYCGSCETRVLGGTPEHRDVLLSDEERAASKTMMICVSRAISDRLVLDL